MGNENKAEEIKKYNNLFWPEQYGRLLSNSPSFFARERKPYQIELGLFSFFNRNYVPFLEGGDVDLDTIQSLLECTPTWGACNKIYKDYGLSGDLGVTASKRSAFRKTKKVEVSEAEENSYIDFIDNTIGSKKLIDEINKAGGNLLGYGNYVIELSFFEVIGVMSANIRVYDFSMFRYKVKKNYSDPNEIEMGIICEDFREKDLLAKSQEIAMFPNFTAMPTGEIRTLIHYKNEAINRNFYGLPYVHQAFNSIYLDYQQGKFANIQFDNQLVLKLIIEMFGTGTNGLDTPRLKSLQSKLNEAFTMGNNGSNAKEKTPVALSMNNVGEEAKPMNVHQINTENSWQYQETIAKIIDNKILPLAGINEILFKRGGNNLSGGNALEKAEIGFYFKSIVGFQNQVLSGFLLAIKTIELFFDYQNPNNLQIQLLPSEYMQSIIERNQMEVAKLKAEVANINATPTTNQ